MFNFRSLFQKQTLILLAAVALSLGCVAVALGTCSPHAAETRDTSLSSTFTSHTSYHWDNLQRDEKGRLSYVEDGNAASQTGVDVSEHQGYIDWSAVAADDIDFAMIRVGNRGATEGALAFDDYFAYNLGSALDAGLDVGVYFFSQATTEAEAVEEAEFVLNALGGAALTYPIAYDHERIAGVEGRADDLTVEQMTANARAFCDRIAQAGYIPAIYGNASDLARYDFDNLGDCGVWFAEYGTEKPRRDSGFSIWQYANDGIVSGIETVVDLNIRLPRD